MATIIYLDVDDEITSAAARIRSAPETKVGLVLPPGSRLATSRINFRLLAREGLERNRVLSIVAADPAARSIAASAGLPVFTTVAEYEAAIGPPRTPPPTADPPQAGEPGPGSSVRSEGASARRRGRGAAAAAGAAAASGAAAGASSVVADAAAGAAGASAAPQAPRAEQLTADLVAPTIDESETVVAPTPSWQPVPAVPEAPPGPPGARARSGAATIAVVPAVRRRGAPSGLALALGGVIIGVLILAAAAWLVLPQATVVLTPVAVPVGPVEFVVRADPDAATVDAAGGVIPATRLSQDFTASGQYPATGKRVVQTKARGSVTFRNCDTSSGHLIPGGSVVSTGGGTEFATGTSASLPRATVSGPSTITCSTADTAITALLAGTRGNVAVGAIDQIPPGFDNKIVFVTNPAKTTGGTRQEFTRVQQADIDAAMAALTKDLQAQFAAWVAAPPDLPAGTTAYPSTGKLSTPVPSLDPGSLLNVEEATFQLGASATGTVVAVDTSQIDQVAAQRVSVNVPADHTLQDGSVSATHDRGQADGELIDFRVTANGAAVPVLDEAALRDSIKGKTVDEARGILGRYGKVTIDTWPGFVSSIPSLDFRLDLTVNGAGGAASPSPGPSGGAP